MPEKDNNINNIVDKVSQNSFIRRIKTYLRKTEAPSVYEKLLEVLNDYMFNKSKSNSDVLEISLLKNIVSLKHKKVKNIMIPRVDIVGIEYNSSLKEVLEVVQVSKFSRIPVYKETLDDILGFIYAKDLVSLINTQSKFKIDEIMRQIIFISPYMQVLDLVYDMKMKGIHMAMVVDEFGGVDGLISIVDVLKEIVGTEYDLLPDKMFKHIKAGFLECDARIELDELEEQVGKFLSEEEKSENNTLAGLIFYLVGRIPSKAELIVHPSGVEFEILSSDPSKINKILVHYL